MTKHLLLVKIMIMSCFDMTIMSIIMSLHVLSALCLAVGIIFYISAVNDEVSHRKKSQGGGGEPAGFEYRYGWAFFFAGSSFVSAMSASVSNISLYLRRFPEHSADTGRSQDMGKLIEPSSMVGSVSRVHEIKETLYVPRRSSSRMSITTPV